MAEHNEIGESVWQGYVSAVASLLMSLLLLLAVLALCISILGRFRTHSSSGEAEITSSDTPMFRASEVLLPDGHDESSYLRELGATPNWALIFQRQTIEIQREFYPTIAAAIFGNADSSFEAYRWLLVAMANTSSSDETRIAYLRLISAREFLLHEGVAHENIDLRIVDASIQIDGSERIPVLISRIETEIVE